MNTIRSPTCSARDTTSRSRHSTPAATLLRPGAHWWYNCNIIYKMLAVLEAARLMLMGWLQRYSEGKEQRCKPRPTPPRRGRRRRQRGLTDLPFCGWRTVATPVCMREMLFRRVRAQLVAGALTSGGLTSRRRHVMYRTAED